MSAEARSYQYSRRSASATNTLLLYFCVLYLPLSGLSSDRGSDRTSRKTAAKERSKRRKKKKKKRMDKMIGWWAATATATLLTFVGYVAFFWKINWVRGLQTNGDTKRSTAGYSGIKNRKIGEIPPVYPNGWFAILESSQLAKGQVKHVVALGENFAVFRTEKGQVNILDAYCPHLGANMAEGGKVKGDCLECPFHSWRFRGNGTCDSIPYAEKIPLLAKAKAWNCCEVNKLIFVWYHAESSEPDWRPQPLESISNGTWWYHGRNEFLISCHIQEIPENGADWAHLSAVHGPAMFFKDILPGLMRHAWTEAAWAPQASLENSSLDDSNVEHLASNTVGLDDSERSDLLEDKRHVATMKLCHSLVLFESISMLELHVTAEQIGPGYVELMLQTSFGPMCILQTVTPIEPMVQRVTHKIFAPPLLGPYARIVFWGECLMFERDIAVWNNKKFEKKPILVSEDRTIKAYRRWYKQFYSLNSPTYKSIKSLEW